MKLTAIVLTGLVLTAMSGAPAYAGGADHLTIPESYDASEHFAAGEGTCVDWPGTFHEARTGTYDVTAAPGGQVAGEYHVNGVIDGFVELIPDDPALPTYSGTYREKVNVIVSGATDDGDVLRIGQYRLRLPLRGTDGTSLTVTLSGKSTITATGRVVVERDSFDCG